MSAEAMFKRRIVRIHRERRASGFFFATSDDLTGLVVSAKTMQELDDQVPQVVMQMYAACGTPVMAAWVDEAQIAAVPVDVAKRALDQAQAIAAN